MKGEKMKKSYERPVAVIMADGHWSIACPKCGKTKEVRYLGLNEEDVCSNCQEVDFPIEILQDELLKLLVEAPANKNLYEREGHMFTEKTLPAKLFPDKRYNPYFVALALQLLLVAGYVEAIGTNNGRQYGMLHSQS